MAAALALLAAYATLHGGAVLYTWRRCAQREPFWRHARRRSAVLAPLNALIYACSALPDRSVHAAASVPGVRGLRAGWRIAKEEGTALLERDAIRPPAWTNDAKIAAFHERGWHPYYLLWHGDVLPSAQATCPRTVELLSGLPQVRGAMFAVLRPGARLEPHTDPFAGTLRCHVGLGIPAGAACWLEVDGQRHTWTEGEALVFDETYLHSAANHTSDARLVLLCDVERPLRYRWATALQRAARALLMSVVAVQNEPGDPVGWPARLAGLLAGPRRAGDPRRQPAPASNTKSRAS